jgi:hypothetical protein
MSSSQMEIILVDVYTGTEGTGEKSGSPRKRPHQGPPKFSLCPFFSCKELMTLTPILNALDEVRGHWQK